MSDCFLVGPPDVYETIYPTLVSAIDLAITHYGATRLLMGHWNAFDRMATHAAIRAKENHPHIRLVLLTAGDPADDPIDLPPAFDEVLHAEGVEADTPPNAASGAAAWAMNNASCFIIHARFWEHEDLWRMAETVHRLKHNFILI